MAMPKFKPRRLYDSYNPAGYLESDLDYVMNNLERCVRMLEKLEKKIPASKRRRWKNEQ